MHFCVFMSGMGVLEFFSVRCVTAIFKNLSDVMVVFPGCFRDGIALGLNFLLEMTCFYPQYE